MATIKSGASSDVLTIDPVSKAGRVTLYDATGRELSPHSKKTYSASATFTPAATPNDLMTIFGSASRTVRVISLKFGATNTAAGSQQYFLHKKSALPTGGVHVLAAMVPLDSNNGGATATMVGHYTTDPTAGTSLGTINTVRVASPAPVPASFAGIVQSATYEMLPVDPWGMAQPVTLRGIAEGLAVNFNDVALVAGQTHLYTVVWTEE